MLFFYVVSPMTYQALQTNYHTTLTWYAPLGVSKGRRHPKMSIHFLIDTVLNMFLYVKIEYKTLPSSSFSGGSVSRHINIIYIHFSCQRNLLFMVCKSIYKTKIVKWYEQNLLRKRDYIHLFVYF